MREVLVNYKSTAWAILAFFALMVSAVTFLSAIDKSADALVMFVASQIIPAILILINQATTDQTKNEVKRKNEPGEDDNGE